MTEVKPGQVWVSKNMGSRWMVRSTTDDGLSVLLDREGATRVVMHHVLFDDYVLVKEAP